MAKESTAAYDPRQLWAANLAPLVAAAREGATHAARTAGRERARARQESQQRRRWLIVAAAGLLVAGAVGGAYAAMARRRSSVERPAAGSEQSTMGTGRDKVADLARTVAHKFRGNGGDGDGRGDGQGRLPGSQPAERPAMATTAPDESRNEARRDDRAY